MNTVSSEKNLMVKIKDFMAFLTINNPEKRNALSDDICLKIQDHLGTFSENDDIRCVIFRGSGHLAFSSGYDISAIPVDNSNTSNAAPKTPDAVLQALEAIKTFPYPTIAMLNGSAFGAGFNLCACCDVRIASNDIKIGMTPARLGVVYHPKGIQQFIEAFGIARTKEIFYTAKVFYGKELIQKELVDYMVPGPELEKFTLDYAKKITRNAPLSLKGIKKTISLFEKQLALKKEDYGLALDLVQESLKSFDVKEGQAAFLEKRKPKFKGH